MGTPVMIICIQAAAGPPAHGTAAFKAGPQKAMMVQQQLSAAVVCAAIHALLCDQVIAIAVVAITSLWTTPGLPDWGTLLLLTAVYAHMSSQPCQACPGAEHNSLLPLGSAVHTPCWLAAYSSFRQQSNMVGLSTGCCLVGA